MCEKMQYPIEILYEVRVSTSGLNRDKANSFYHYKRNEAITVSQLCETKNSKR